MYYLRQDSLHWSHHCSGYPNSTGRMLELACKFYNVLRAIGSNNFVSYLLHRTIAATPSEANCIIHISNIRSSAVVKIKAFNLTRSLREILQTASWSKPIRDQISWRSNNFVNISLRDIARWWWWWAFERVHRSWLTERACQLMNCNRPIWSGQTISIDSINGHRELSLSICRVNRDVNYSEED